jgi:hypothetical protein
MSFPALHSATINNNQTTSTVINKGIKPVSAVQVLDSNASGTITVQGSFNGALFFNVVVHISASNTPNQNFTLPTGAGNFLVTFPPWILEKIPYVRFVSSNAITAPLCQIELY